MPAATLTRFQPKQSTISNRVKGSDNLEIISTAAGMNYALGSEILSGGLTAHSSARLSSLSNAFQRIKWHSISFTIEGAYPTTSGGGYIACFVRDPDDVPPTDPVEAVRWAMAQQHSADAKWYDSVRLNVGPTPDLLFTSKGAAPRLYSPGTLFVISKGGPAQVGALTVNFHWDVTLSEPTSDNGNKEPDTTFVSNGDYYFPFAGVSGGFLPLSLITTADPSPQNIHTRPVVQADLGINVPDGTYLRFRRPVPITGFYNTGNDYVPIYVNGVVWSNSYSVFGAVSELGGKYYVIGTGSPPVPPGYQTSDWKTLSGGYGAVIEELEIVDKYLNINEVHNKQVALRKLPRRAFEPYSRVSVPGGIDPNVALTNLTGEQWPTLQRAS